MSAPFKDKQIHSAFFTNEANDTIEVMYNQGSEESPEFISTFVPATDASNYMLRDLQSMGWDFEKIAITTVQRKRFEAALWNSVVKRHASEQIKAAKQEYQTKIDEVAASAVVGSGDILSAVLKYNEDTDSLFRSKLAVFELDEIKQLKDRTLKQRIRTAKTFLQLFAVLNEVIK